jgi:hypothetical protein
LVEGVVLEVGLGDGDQEVEDRRRLDHPFVVDLPVGVSVVDVDRRRSLAGDPVDPLVVLLPVVTWVVHHLGVSIMDPRLVASMVGLHPVLTMGQGEML